MIKKLLTSNYNKDKESNISKVTKIIADEIAQIKSLLTAVEDHNDMNNARGLALDLIGDNVRQPRGMAIDEVYRLIIRTKTGVDLSDGSINGILEFTKILLETDDVLVYEGTDVNYHSVILGRVPFEKLNRLGVSPNDFFKLINGALAAGVALEYISSEGTFEYGFDVLITDCETGYSSATCAGGTLGYTVDEQANMVGTLEYGNLLTTSGIGYADVQMKTGGTLGTFYKNK